MACPIPDHLVAAYREEAAGLVADFEAALLPLQQTPGEPEPVHRAIQAVSTVRGSASMFSFDHLASFAQDLEAVLAAVRDGWVRMTPELATLLLEAKDLLRGLLDGSAPGEIERARLVTALRSRLPTAEAVLPAGPPLPPPVPTPGGRKTFRLRFRPHPDLFHNGTRVLGLLDELRSLGRYRAVARTDALPTLEELQPETSYLGVDVILTTDRGLDAVLEAFTFVDGRCELKVEVVDDEQAPAADPDVRLGQILVDRGEVSPEQIDRTLAGRQRLGELLEARGLVSSEAIEAAVVEQKVVREERLRRDPPAVEGGEAVRVAASELHRIADLTGELVLAQVRLARIATRSADPELVRLAQDVGKLSAELRDRLLGIRRPRRA